jgi:hypothetical protein
MSCPRLSYLGSMREAWTDERLDDLNGRVADMGRRMDEGFNRVDGKIESLRADMDAKFMALHRLVLQVGGGMIVTLVIGILSVVATQL